MKPSNVVLGPDGRAKVLDFGIARLVPSSAPPGPEAPVVAVLPLSNTSGDASNDYLGAGLAESLITSLASVQRGLPL